MPSKHSTNRCSLSGRKLNNRRILCFFFAGAVVLAAILASVLLTRESKESNGGNPSSLGGDTSTSMEDASSGHIPTSNENDFYPGGDEFDPLTLNGVKNVCEEPISTFSADVDTSSYSYCRRMLNSDKLPPSDAVRAEEMINYFDYNYPLPSNKSQPFEPAVMISDSPWNDGHRLLHIGIKGYDIEPSERPPSNLVFLLDVSGSMNDKDRLPLVKKSIELLLSALDPELDVVSIVTYSGVTQVVLEPTPVSEDKLILDALHQLEASGSTAGGAGLAMAYEMAEQNFNKEGINRIILATDGDFNVGITDNEHLQSFVEQKREQGIFLSVLGFGVGNYKDSRMKALANHGNGVAMYIDTIEEAQKVMVTEAQANIFPIAKDVKFQVEFNPAAVSEYRLIGYEKRLLEQEDFNNDTVDAGEIGSGHTVTVIYEYKPVAEPNSGNFEEICSANGTNEHLNGQGGLLSGFDNGVGALLKMRYKLPEGNVSEMMTHRIRLDDIIDDETVFSREFYFASAVAGFAQILQGGEHIGNYSFDDVIALAEIYKGQDEYGYRSEFVQLVQKARSI